MNTSNQTPVNIAKWMPLWIGDIRRETIGQPLEFIGMYVHLMMAAWENGGQLPDDEKHLYRTSGAASAQQWMEHRQGLANLFVPGRGMWTHNRIRDELMRAANVSKRRRDASQKGNDIRWGRGESKAAADSILAKISKDGTAY